MYNYNLSAVVGEVRETYKTRAVSDKQARFFFTQRYGFRIRDFRIESKTMDSYKANTSYKIEEHKQLSLNI